jgi:hypothetical protein
MQKLEADRLTESTKRERFEKQRRPGNQELRRPAVAVRGILQSSPIASFSAAEGGGTPKQQRHQCKQNRDRARDH